MLEVLRYLQVDASRLEIVAVSDASEAAAALRRGEVKMACASGSALTAMADLGRPLLDAETKEQLGLKLFDAVVVATDYMNENS